MNVYVESNFVVEIARQQEESPSAQALLRLAESGPVRLTFPVFAVCEPFSTLTRYGSERNQFVDLMNRQLRELGRLAPHRSLVSVLQPVGQTLLSIQRQEMDLLEATVQAMLTVGRSIPMTGTLIGEARRFETRYDLSPPDAIVYASILSDLRRRPRKEPKCFVSRNSKDFGDATIMAELLSFGCRYIASFAGALSYVQSVLGPVRTGDTVRAKNQPAAKVRRRASRSIKGDRSP